MVDPRSGNHLVDAQEFFDRLAEERAREDREWDRAEELAEEDRMAEL